MIFKPQLLEQIFAGRKTVTRRPADNEAICKYQAGKTYAILPGMARQAVGRIRIVEVSRIALGAIDDAEARREGFENADEFIDYWRALYRGQFDADAPVWRIEFELIEQTHAICRECAGRGATELPHEAEDDARLTGPVGVAGARHASSRGAE